MKTIQWIILTCCLTFTSWLQAEHRIPVSANPVFEIPVPEIPAAGAVVYSPHPHFRWHREMDVRIDEIHQIQIAKDQAFANVACDDRLEVVSRFVPVNPLVAGKYWWRVRRGAGQWSRATPFEVCDPENVFTIRKGSDAATVARIFQDAAGKTPARVNFEPADYELTPGLGKSLVSLYKVSNLIVDGQGARLVLGGAFLSLTDCQRVTIQNFTVKPIRPGHTLVRIISKDPAKGCLVVKPEPGYDPDVTRFYGENNGGSFLGCMDQDPVRHGKYLIGASISAHSKNPPRLSPSPDDHGAYVFSPVDAKSLEGFPIGCPAIITAYSWQWVTFVRGEECTFSHVTLSDLPGAFSGGGSSAKSMLACKVILPTPQGFFGGHSACGNGRVGEWIEACEFECLADDGPAEQSFRIPVSASNGADAILVAGSLANSSMAEGSRVALLNPKGDHSASATVMKVTETAKGLRVQLDRPLVQLASAIGRDACADWKGVFLYVDSPSNEDFVYRHNRHVGGRGHGLKFNGTRGLIADSYFENINGNAIMAGYLSEVSGHGASDVLISGNTIVRCGWAPITSTSKSGLSENLIIRNNHISEVRASGIYVKGYRHVSIFGNEMKSSVPPADGAWIVIQKCADVICKDNKCPEGLPEEKTKE